MITGLAVMLSIGLIWAFLVQLGVWILRKLEGRMPYTEEEVGYAGRDTSEKAALSLDLDKISRMKLAILKALEAHADHGATVDELSSELKISPFTLRPRVAELAKIGALEDGGDRRLLQSGKPGIVWVLAASLAEAAE